MPSALNPVKQDYYFVNGKTRDIARTEIQYLEDRVRVSVNGLEVTLPADALCDMHALESRWGIVRAIHQGQAFKICYSNPAVRKSPEVDEVIFVQPLALNFTEVKQVKNRTWVMQATVGTAVREFIVGNIRAIWDITKVDESAVPTEAVTA